MRTIKRAETRSISIDSPPAAVHNYLADARNLPAWAAAFAPRIRRDGDRWIVTAEDREFTIDVLAEPTSKSVDIVSASDHNQGLFTRVLPNAEGSELVFTLLFPADTPESAINAQLLTLDSELAAVRDACQ
jgi:hypothetical protein